MDLQYEYTKQDVGNDYDFEDSEPQLLIDIHSDDNLLSDYVLKTPVNKMLQCGTQYAEHEGNTVRLSYESNGINHVEGGWPKDINYLDTEQTVRYRKKIDKDDMYIHSVHQLSYTMEQCILQNNAIDIYELYFEDEETSPSVPSVLEKISYKTRNVYKDTSCYMRRPIQDLSWSPDGGSRLAASYCHLDFEYIYSEQCVRSYIWNIENPNSPEIVFEPISPMVCLEYNPKDSHSLISGLYNGQVAFWDTRKNSDPAEISSPECSHTDPVLNILWMNSKSGTEFFSSSADGQIKWWDIRKLNEPTETLIVDTTKGELQKLTRAHGISSLEYDNSIPVRFMVGTETGLVISGNRKGKTPAEKLTAQYKAHDGPVYALQRNPSFIKIFLTVGDWCAKIWSEDCRESAIIWTRYHNSRLTSGMWNPVKFSVFYTIKVDGTLDVWDILQNQTNASCVVKVCDAPLRSLQCHENGRLIAVGSDTGSAYVLEFSENLGCPAKNDKTLLTSIFERESRREKIIESKMKEMRLRSKFGKVMSSHLSAKETSIKPTGFVPLNQTTISTAEKEFFKIIHDANNSV